jgi:hypothetical protein
LLEDVTKICTPKHHLLVMSRHIVIQETYFCFYAYVQKGKGKKRKEKEENKSIYIRNQTINVSDENEFS